MTSQPGVDVPPNAIALIRQPMAVLPIAMSVGALAMVVWQLAVHGTAPQPDETAQVRLWQILVAGQVPVIARFAAAWLRRSSRPALLVLALQVAAVALIAVAPVYVLGAL